MTLLTSQYNSWKGAVESLGASSIRNQWITMRDGVRLDTNIYLPLAVRDEIPAILVRSPYPERAILDKFVERYSLFLKNGYALVYQYERGRYWSEGDSSYLANAKYDGYDTIDWLAKQSWSNGKVGTFGCSSSAENQLSLSVANHPAHAAAIAQAPGAGIGRVGPYSEQGNIYRGGALQLMFASWFNEAIMYGKRGAHMRPQFPADLSQAERNLVSQQFDLHSVHAWGEPRKNFNYEAYYKHLPVCEINQAADGLPTDWDDFARRTPAAPQWEETPFASEGDNFAVPMLWVFSWYDVAVAPNVALYQDACVNAVGRCKNHQYLIIGPMVHCKFGEEKEQTKVGDRDIGDARYPYYDQYLEWFDYWLKDKPALELKQPKVSYYQMGENQWVQGDQFPVITEQSKAVTKTYYLQSQGQANTLLGDGVLSDVPPISCDFDKFVYDPKHPVPTLGGGACCMGNIQAEGSYDQSDLEMRNDILVYSSEPLIKDLTVTGFVEVELYVTSSASDTDFTLKLIDVYPDGRAYNLDDTIFRVRYREGYGKALSMQKDEVYKLVFPPMITGNTFKVGHCIRLEVSSSNFPHYDRNLNTGGNNYDERELVIAVNSVFHSPDRLSKIVFPVLDNEGSACL